MQFFSKKSIDLRIRTRESILSSDLNQLNACLLLQVDTFVDMLFNIYPHADHRDSGGQAADRVLYQNRIHIISSSIAVHKRKSYLHAYTALKHCSYFLSYLFLILDKIKYVRVHIRANYG